MNLSDTISQNVAFESLLQF